MKTLKSSRKKSNFPTRRVSLFISRAEQSKFGSSSVEGAYMAGVTDDYADIFSLEFAERKIFYTF